MWNKMLNAIETKKSAVTSTPVNSIYRDASQSYRQPMLPDRLPKPKVQLNILLVDDDPVFGRTMQRAAEIKGVKLTYCKSPEEVGALGSYEFNAIIMDYDLGAVTGFELTEYLEENTREEVPVILVSQTKHKSSIEWPSSVREFVHKRLGPFAILDAIFEAHEIRELHRSMRRTHNQ